MCLHVSYRPHFRSKSYSAASRSLVALAVMLTAAGGYGCTTTRGYDGPARAASEVARVEAHGVRFHEVNGMKVGVHTSEVEVLPGRNELAVSINASNITAADADNRLHTLVFRAQAGKEYAVTGRRGDGRLCAFPIVASGDPDFSNPAGCIGKEN